LNRKRILALLAAALAPMLAAAGLASAHAGVAPAVVSIAATSAASAPQVKRRPVAPAARLVDINSASRSALMTLPGIGNAEAGRIIAGRPYLTKAHLVTHKVLTMAQYQSISGSIIARQKARPPAGAKKGKS
jgi:competence protein ComEA